MPRVVKPARPALQRRHPLARGLQLAYPCWERGGPYIRELVRRQDMTLGGNIASTSFFPSWARAKLGTCLQFDGSDDYADTGSADWAAAGGAYTGALTMAVWYRPAYTNPTNQATVFWRGRDGSGNGWSAGIYQEVTTGLPKAGIVTSDGGFVGWTAAGTTALSANAWYHLCLAWYPGSEVRLYVNGRQAGTTAVTAGKITLRASTIGWSFARHTSGQYAAGQIADGRVWSRALPNWLIRLAYVDPWGLYEPRSARETLAAVVSATVNASVSAALASASALAYAGAPHAGSSISAAIAIASTFGYAPSASADSSLSAALATASALCIGGSAFSGISVDAALSTASALGYSADVSAGVSIPAALALGSALAIAADPQAGSQIAAAVCSATGLSLPALAAAGMIISAALSSASGISYSAAADAAANISAAVASATGIALPPSAVGLIIILILRNAGLLPINREHGFAAFENDLGFTTI